MVGDSLEEDIYIAQRSGMHTVWIMNPLTKGTKVPNIAPDASVSLEHIDTLPQVIVKIV
jgi:FMN phosphatase YigB (HAD superfamily)